MPIPSVGSWVMISAVIRDTSPHKQKQKFVIISKKSQYWQNLWRSEIDFITIIYKCLSAAIVDIYEKTTDDILLFGYQTKVDLCGTGCLILVLRDLSVNVDTLPL
jgi:hypothetical protein